MSIIAHYAVSANMVRFIATGLVAIGWVTSPGTHPGLAQTKDPSVQASDDLLERARAAFDSLEPVTVQQINRPAVRLGQALFWDMRLSANGQIACASCHLTKHWAADAEAFSTDARGAKTKRNTQTVFNATLQSKLRWVGDRDSAAQQAEKSLTGSMGFDQPEQILPLLKQFGYEARFREAFPDTQTPLTPQNYASAIAAYEDTLRTPAPFDRFLAGEPTALSAEQQRGLKLFLETGCVDCHAGRLLGGEGLQTFGVHGDYRLATHSTHSDVGLFETTKQAADKDQFRVAMLRNIAKTAPYFHDGSVENLRAAVEVMAQVQLNQKLKESDTLAIVAFLESLTGEIPENYCAPAESEAGRQQETKLTVERLNNSEMSSPDQVQPSWQLKQFGTMREAIGLGQHQGRVNLGELANKPHFYGVGALAGLRGEITIVNSEVFVTSVDRDGQAVTASFEDAAALEATLLLGGQVIAWTELNLERDLQPQELDRFLAVAAQKSGLEIGNPLPFLIEGELLAVHVHVINGACPVHARRNNETIPQDRLPYDLRSEIIPGTVVGIYAPNAAGRMTHPGTSVHAHLVFENDQKAKLTGHLEQFGVRKGAMIKFPQTVQSSAR